MKKYLLMSFFVCSNICSASTIWFCPINTDFLNHKNLEPDWLEASKKIDVFKFYSGVVHDAPQQSLEEKIDTLKSKNIKVSIEVPVLTWDGSSKKVEGYESKGYLKYVLEKFKASGGTVDYLSMDEPLYYGYYKKNDKSYVSYLNDLKETLSVVWSIYPNVKIVDVEPLSQFQGDFIKNNYQQWLIDFKKSTGRNIYALHADLYWEGDYKHDIQTVYPVLKKNNVQLGIIFNADKNNNTNLSWIQQADKNISNYYNYVKINPNQVVFQSWSHYPNKILPETASDSHLNMIDMFAKKYN